MRVCRRARLHEAVVGRDAGGGRVPTGGGDEQQPEALPGTNAAWDVLPAGLNGLRRLRPAVKGREKDGKRQRRRQNPSVPPPLFSGAEGGKENPPEQSFGLMKRSVIFTPPLFFMLLSRTIQSYLAYHSIFSQRFCQHEKNYC